MYQIHLYLYIYTIDVSEVSDAGSMSVYNEKRGVHFYIDNIYLRKNINNHQRKLNGQSRIENSEKPAALDTQDEDKTKQKTKKNTTPKTKKMCNTHRQTLIYMDTIKQSG